MAAPLGCNFGTKMFQLGHKFTMSRRFLHPSVKRALSGAILNMSSKYKNRSAALPPTTSCLQDKNRACLNYRSHSNGPFDRDQDGDGQRRKIMLMLFPELIWPHPVKYLKNMFFTFLLRSYFDEHFGQSSFLEGATQAIAVVSRLISDGKFDQLSDLVDREVIPEIQSNYEKLSSAQKKWIAVNPKDAFLKFIYEIGVIMDDHTNERFVEITMVLQGFHGLDDVREKDPHNYPDEIKNSPEKVFVCNYRFIREYTKGVDADWTINIVNHFSPRELVQNSSIFRR